MTELEQLRKEVNELRERIAALEQHNERTAWGDMMNMRIGGGEPHPRFVARDPLPPNTTTCLASNPVFSTTER